jgi:hypothetical protein
MEMEILIGIALIATISMGILLFNHIMFKREILKLKEEMVAHKLKNGVDEELWNMFIKGTNLIFRFKR